MFVWSAIDLLVNIDRLQYTYTYTCTRYVAWGETVRFTDGIGMQKGERHRMAKCATTLVLVPSNYVPTNRNRLYPMNHPIVALKILHILVFLIGLSLLVCLWCGPIYYLL